MSAAVSVAENSVQSVYVVAAVGVIVRVAICKSVCGVSGEGFILVASLATAEGATVGEPLIKKV
jgi:hypothetical protein